MRNDVSEAMIEAGREVLMAFGEGASARDMAQQVYAAMRAADNQAGDGLDARTRRLVIAARNVAFSDRAGEEKLAELDMASEAFANDVPWDDEPAPPRADQSPDAEVV